MKLSPYKIFTRRLRELRKQRGIKQDTVAEALRLTSAAYSHIERGFNQMPLPYAFVIADLFKMPVWQLFYTKSDLSQNTLTEDEERILFKYRLLKNEKKELIHKLLEGLRG